MVVEESTILKREPKAGDERKGKRRKTKRKRRKKERKGFF